MLRTIKIKLVLILLMLCVFVVLMGGSLAWRDESQHKTNSLVNRAVYHNVVLVEDFVGVNDWLVDEAYPKRVSVRNGQVSDDVLSTDYGRVFVRVQFKEFMSLGHVEMKYSERRFLIDESNRFIRFDSKDAGESYLKSHQVPSDTVVESVKGFYDEQEYFYLSSMMRDEFGQYGKFLVLDVVEDDHVSLVSGQMNMSSSAFDQHQDHVNGEDDYVVHQWDASSDDYSKASAFSEYVSWKLHDDVITLDEWDGIARGVWILDTRPGESWAYWGLPLEHSTIKSEASQTQDLLESVSLIKELEQSAQYYIHVNLDAVSDADLKLWSDAPLEIMEVFNSID